MAENKFMELLSDIDEKFIADMADERVKKKTRKKTVKKAVKKDTGPKIPKEKETPYQTAKIVTVNGKKRSLSFVKIFSYIAAALLITAAVSLGAHLIREKLPIDPAYTMETENTVPSQTEDTVTLPGTSNGVPISYITLKDIWEKDFHFKQEEMQEETDLSDYPAVVLSHIPNIDDSYEKTSKGYGEGDEKIIAKAVLDTKKCGDLNLSLIGYGLFTDNRAVPDRVIALWGFRIVLEKDGSVVSSESFNDSVYNYLFDNDETEDGHYYLYKLHKDHLNEFTAVGDFGDHQVIMARIIKDDFVARTQFFGVKNDALYVCFRTDNKTVQSEMISGASSFSDIQYDHGTEHRCSVRDELLKREYVFDFGIFDIVEYEVITEEDAIVTDIDRYSFIKDVNIPYIDIEEFEGSFEDKAKMVIAGSLPRVILNVNQDREYTIYLVGEYLSRSENSLWPKIRCCNLKILIYQDDKYIDCIIPDESSYFSMTEIEYSELMPQLFVTVDNIALIVKRELSNSYYGSDCFYAVKNGVIYRNFNGYYDNAFDDPPEWTQTAVKHDYIIWDENTESVICGFYRYEFDFSELETGAIGIYNVYWLEEEPK